MADLEQEKDLEEDEFKTNVKPSTSREMTTRNCKPDVNYQFDESDLDEDSDDGQIKNLVIMMATLHLILIMKQ